MEMRRADLATAVGSAVMAVVLWEALVRLLGIPIFVLPAPSRVVVEAATRYPLYLYHGWVTMYETLVGFLLAGVVGVVMAIGIVYSRFLYNGTYPLIVALQIVPKVAIAPLLLIWAGYGVTSKVLLALLVAFFPIVVNMATGLWTVEAELLELCRILHSGRWQEFYKVRLPNALPHLFSGLKVASTLAVIGAVIGEFVGGNEGLGYLIIIANTELRTPMAFASLAGLSLLGLALFGALAVAERLLMPWERRPEGLPTPGM
jgi:NitT/TauT family transport system permease protein